ncbi:hypothetical protein BV20DRAFT_962649 [Pilatotrama ljubarskyi]|nr:hypothetical protein BV20DRAFT_962649 [Pilatotrama ljubarskyi]
MDSLPQETLRGIFELACTDGGYTGNSLSRVSKAIRAASRMARFHSISLIANPRRLASFLALYERECNLDPAERPRVRHLFVAFPRSVQGDSYERRRRRSLSPPLDWYRWAATVSAPGHSDHEDTVSPTPASEAAIQDIALPAHPVEDMDVEDLEEELEYWDWSGPIKPRPDPTASPAYLDAARKLFRLVTPDLLTLAIQSGFTYGGRLEYGIIEDPFPILREVTFIDVKAPELLFIDEAADNVPSASANGPLFPALTHLHFVTEYGDADLHLPQWSARAPRVTHLRITGVHQGHVQQFESALGVKVDPFRGLRVHIPGDFELPPPSLPPRTYPSLRYLIMQPQPLLAGGFCGNPLIDFENMLWDLWEIVGGCRGTERY